MAAALPRHHASVEAAAGGQGDEGGAMRGRAKGDDGGAIRKLD